MVLSLALLLVLLDCKSVVLALLIAPDPLLLFLIHLFKYKLPIQPFQCSLAVALQPSARIYDHLIDLGALVSHLEVFGCVYLLLSRSRHCETKLTI